MPVLFRPRLRLVGRLGLLLAMLAALLGAAPPPVGAAGTGRILGTVTSTSGVSLPQISVTVYERTGFGTSYVGSAGTGSDGSYVVSGLDTGTYLLDFQDYAGTYASEYYDDVQGQTQATGVDVTAGQDVTVRDAALAPASHLAGTVTGTGGGAVAGAQVTAYYVESSGFLDYAGFHTTDAAGHYDVGGLAAGSYRLGFSDPQDRYLPEYYDDQQDLNVADPVTVAAGATRSGVDAALTAAASISGTVTGDGSHPLAQVAVTAYRKAGHYWQYAGGDQVGSDGTYRLGPLRAGTYRVGFVDNASFYAPQYWRDRPTFGQATAIKITAGRQMAGIDAALHPGSHVTGIVTDARGRPVSGAQVDAYAYQRAGDTYFQHTGEALTDDSGHYDIGGLAAGAQRFCFHDGTGRLVDECWDDVPSVEQADDVAVPAQGTTAGIGAALATSGHITGVVTGADGTPLTTAYVVVTHVDPATGDVDESEYASTDSHGAYDVGGLRAGTWILHFRDTSEQYADEWWDDQLSQADADPITVTAGKTVRGRNAQLSPVSHLTGRVIDAGGQPLADVWVYAYDATGESVASRVTDASGAYDVGDLRGGGYRLWFVPSDHAYAQQYYRNRRTLAKADPITVGRAQTVGVPDVRLAPAAAGASSPTTRARPPVTVVGRPAGPAAPTTG